MKVATTARDAAVFAARIPLGAGRLLAKRIPAPVGPTVTKVIDTVDVLLPHGGRGGDAGTWSSATPEPGPGKVQGDPLQPASPAGEPAERDDEADSPKPHGDPLRPVPQQPTEKASDETTDEVVPPLDEMPTPADMPGAKNNPEAVPTAAQVAAEEQSEVTTPVGTTGADVGFNPDTAETDLQQPGTEPLLDPSTTKQVAKEAETLAKAADPEKG